MCHNSLRDVSVQMCERTGRPWEAFVQEGRCPRGSLSRGTCPGDEGSTCRRGLIVLNIFLVLCLLVFISFFLFLTVMLPCCDDEQSCIYLSGHQTQLLISLCTCWEIQHIFLAHSSWGNFLMPNAQSWRRMTYIKFKKEIWMSLVIATWVSDFLIHCCVAKQSISKSTFRPNFALLPSLRKWGTDRQHVRVKQRTIILL